MTLYFEFVERNSSEIQGKQREKLKQDDLQKQDQFLRLSICTSFGMGPGGGRRA
jgi:hypothetical protein